MDVSTASMLMIDLIYFQDNSKHVANDFGTDEVEKFKIEKINIFISQY